MKTVHVVCMLGLLSWTFAGAMAAERRTVRVGSYENSPKVFTTPDGKTIGIFPDILKQIAAEEDWALQYVHGTWSECLQRLKDGQIDIMLDIAYSPDRAKEFDFGNEAVFINWGKVYTPKDRPIESLLELDGKTIAVVKDCIYAEGPGGIAALLNKFGIHSTLVEVDSYGAVLQLLGEGKVDAGVVNRLFGQQHESNYDVAPTSILFNPCQLMFAYTKGAASTPYLIERIDHHLRAMKQDPDSFLYRTIDGYVVGLPPKIVHSRPGGGRHVYLSTAEKAWIREHPDIRLGIDPEFAPYEFIDENGKYGGIASSYIEILNKRLGTNMKIVPNLTWPEAVEGIQTGVIDVLPCVGMTEQRRKTLAFSHPYIQFQRVVIMRTDEPFIADLSEIHAQRIGVQAASSHDHYLTENTPITPVRFDRFQDAVTALSRGDIDAIVGNLSCASYWIRRLNVPNLKIAAALPSEDNRLYFAVRSDWPELVGILNKGLASIDTAEAEAIRRHWVLVEFEPGMDARKVALWISGVLLGAIVIVGGLTAWNRVLKREIRRREEAERSRDALMHMIVHDLNNQLCPLLGCVDLLMDDSPAASSDPEDRDFYIRQVQKSATEMSSLVEGILSIAKLESGNLPVSLEPVNAAALLKDVCHQFAALAEDKSIVLETMPGPAEVMVLADRQLLSRIVQNLIANSLRYAGQGSQVTCFTSPNEKCVSVGVQDDGPGIPAKYHGRIFDKFFRVEHPKESKTHASGLGLSFCKMAAEAMGGTISVQTPSGGKGVLFLLCLSVPPQADDRHSPPGQYVPDASSSTTVP